MSSTNKLNMRKIQPTPETASPQDLMVEPKSLLSQQSVFSIFLVKRSEPKYLSGQSEVYLPFLYPSFLPLEGDTIPTKQPFPGPNFIAYQAQKQNVTLPFLRPKLPCCKFQSKALGHGMKINPFNGFTFMESNPKLKTFQKYGTFETRFKKKFSKPYIAMVD